MYGGFSRSFAARQTARVAASGSALYTSSRNSPTRITRTPSLAKGFFVLAHEDDAIRLAELVFFRIFVYGVSQSERRGSYVPVLPIDFFGHPCKIHGAHRHFPLRAARFHRPKTVLRLSWRDAIGLLHIAQKFVIDILRPVGREQPFCAHVHEDIGHPLHIKTPDMLHARIADIKLAHELEARHDINTHIGTEANLLRSLSRSPTWRTFLTQHHPVEFTANTLLWNAALEELGAKSASGSAGTARSTGNPATFGSRTEALAQARAMPALGTGLAFRHLQENATVMVMEAMTQKLVAENAPVPSESDAHAALLEDPDWLAYLQKEHPADPAFTAAGTDARERHEQLLRLTRQKIADARGIAQAPRGAPTDGDRMAGLNA